MEPNLWHRGVHGGAAPPIHPWQARTGKPQKRDLLLLPPAPGGCSLRSGCGLRCRVGTQEPGFMAPSALRWVMLCSPGTPQCLCPSLGSACSCLGMDPLLPAPSKGQGADTSHDLTISFSLFFTSVSPWQLVFYLALFSLLPKRIPSM